jgi:anti-sigma B factor antagonist
MAAITRMRTDVENDALVLWVEGEMETDSCDVLEEALREALLVGERTVVDLSQVEFADSTLLLVLLAARRKHKEAGQELWLRRPLSPAVERLMEVTGTTAFFSFAE